MKRPEGRPRKEWMAAWQDVFTAVMVMNWPLMINLYLNATLVSPDIWARPHFQSTVVIQQQQQKKNNKKTKTTKKHVDYTKLQEKVTTQTLTILSSSVRNMLLFSNLTAEMNPEKFVKSPRAADWLRSPATEQNRDPLNGI